MATICSAVFHLPSELTLTACSEVGGTVVQSGGQGWRSRTQCVPYQRPALVEPRCVQHCCISKATISLPIAMHACMHHLYTGC